MKTLKSWKYCLIYFTFLIKIIISNPMWLQASDNTKFLIEIDQKFTWLEAAKVCKLRNAQLVAIDSKEKNNLLIEILSDNVLKGYNMWIGGKNAFGDRGQRDDDDKLEPFFWVSTKQQFSYTNWAEGQPQEDRHIEHCVHILDNSYPPFAWKDDSCQSAKYGYVCQEIPLGESAESGERQIDGVENNNSEESKEATDQTVETTSSLVLTEPTTLAEVSTIHITSTTEIDNDSDHNLTWSHFPTYTSSSV